ncbi:MAG: YqgE/AlgH family protein [Xanthomonadales bacterium]|nr:YqgE/AlgH family protein [Xanthomonadales bacterium]
MDADRSLANHFLIAVPTLNDPNFSRGVTLLCQHNEEGAMGLVINRLSNFRLGEILRQMDIETDDDVLADTPVLAGGPVQVERGFVLHSPERQDWDSTFVISDDLCLTTSRDVLKAMANGEGPERAVVALGYAGWTAGQLETELQQDAWITVRVDPDILFETDLDDRWLAAARLIGVDLNLLISHSGHA